MDKKFYRVYSVKKNKQKDIIELLCFETVNNLTIKPLSFISFSSNEVIEKINKDEAIFRTFYYCQEGSRFLNGSKLIIVNNFLKTNNNNTKEDNLDSLPLFED